MLKINIDLLTCVSPIYMCIYWHVCHRYLNVYLIFTDMCLSFPLCVFIGMCLSFPYLCLFIDMYLAVPVSELCAWYGNIYWHVFLLSPYVYLLTCAYTFPMYVGIFIDMDLTFS